MAAAAVIATLVAVPVAGAAAGMVLWARPQALKIWTLLVALASLAMPVAIVGEDGGAGMGRFFLLLLPAMAFLSLLGQRAHPDSRAAWLWTLVLLGLGLGALAVGDGIEERLLALVLGLIGALLYHYRRVSGGIPWWGIGLCSAGVASLAMAATATPPISTTAWLTACALLLPLIPFQGGYVATFRGLPGNLPAFLAVLLPVLGLHGAQAVFPHLSDELLGVVATLAQMGALYGALRALVQTRVRLVLAYANLSFYSILWWYVAVLRTVPDTAAVYLSAVALATAGLLLAWHAVQARYGDVDLRAIRGLADRMPRFATLVFLLALAMMGVPPFGVFSGLLAMLLTPALPLSGALLVIGIAWLAASWYMLDVTQRVLFGGAREDLRYDDLRRTEAVALGAILALLAVLGAVSPRVLVAGAPMPQVQEAERVLTWNR